MRPWKDTLKETDVPLSLVICEVNKSTGTQGHSSQRHLDVSCSPARLRAGWAPFISETAKPCVQARTSARPSQVVFRVAGAVVRKGASEAGLPPLKPLRRLASSTLLH